MGEEALHLEKKLYEESWVEYFLRPNTWTWPKLTTLLLLQKIRFFHKLSNSCTKEYNPTSSAHVHKTSTHSFAYTQCINVLEL